MFLFKLLGRSMQFIYLEQFYWKKNLLDFPRRSNSTEQFVVHFSSFWNAPQSFLWAPLCIYVVRLRVCVCVSIQSSLCLGCVFQLQQPDCSSPVFMKGLFHFNDAFFCILCEKRAAVTQRLGVCSVAWVWLWDSLRCSCIQEAGGRHARVEYTQHAALRWFLLF